MHDALNNSSGRSVLVLGFGLSGLSASRLLAREGARVTVVDTRDDDALRERAAAPSAQGVEVVLGCDGSASGPAFPGEDGSFDFCILSPGVPADSPWARCMRRRGVPVVAELELGAARCRCPVLAITGTNGKSTLVKLCAETAGLAGRRAAVAGNCGIPLCDVAERSPGLDWAVVEVSSFQLETVERFRPNVGVLLNVQPDHLDRHRDMASYTAVKARLFARMGDRTEEPRKGTCDTGIVNHDIIGEISALSRGKCRWVSFGASPEADVRFAGGELRLGADGPRQTAVSIRGTRFDNGVNGPTAAAAAAAAAACGWPAEAVGQAVRAYQPLPHRAVRIAEAGGVTFVDDSKATNLAALSAALEMADRPVRLLAGGRLKERDLAGPEEMLARKARSVYLFGEASETMREAWSGAVPCFCCGTLDRAAADAWRDAEPGESVLLAPGCASFDQFGGFEERGECFIRIVEELIREDEGS
ncbi:UDP-N-acetylmuramoyl-L-alanine--D-glutamate ligase [Verrucomicrobiota bacterium]